MSDWTSVGGEEDAGAGDTSRRRFCRAVIGGFTVVTVGTVGYPVVTFLGLPRSTRPGEVMRVGLNDLAEGTAVWGEHEGKQIVVIRADGEILAFDGACPHLGCIVHWDGAAGLFKCPCHGAVFQASGDPIAGPVNSPLRRVDFTIEEQSLVIS